MYVSFKYFILLTAILLTACGKAADPSGETTPPAAVTTTPTPASVPVVTPPVAAAAVTALGSVAPAESNNRLFRASVISELEPVVINQLHSWTLHLQTADGAPVERATITVSGSMPAHSHGMPTNPQVTADLGGGNYRVEGIQFQMGGEWEVIFNITAGAVTDAVVFRLTLQ
jgi:YtkA-like